MNTKTSKPLVLEYINILIVFLLFSGGAIFSTMKYSRINGNGMMSNLSWLWTPAMLALFLSALLGWAIYWKKKNH